MLRGSSASPEQLESKWTGGTGTATKVVAAENWWRREGLSPPSSPPVFPVLAHQQGQLKQVATGSWGGTQPLFLFYLQTTCHGYSLFYCTFSNPYSNVHIHNYTSYQGSCINSSCAHHELLHRSSSLLVKKRGFKSSQTNQSVHEMCCSRARGKYPGGFLLIRNIFC